MDNYGQYEDPNMVPSVPEVPQEPQAPQMEQATEETSAPASIDTEIISFVMGRKKASRQWREEYRLEWDQATNDYEMIYNVAGKADWQSTTFQPLIPTHTERAVANLHNMSMGPETPVEYKPRSEADKKRIDCTNKIIQHDMEASKFKVGWTDFLRSLSLYGTAIGRVNYKKETATVMCKKRARSLFSGMMMNLKSMFGFGGIDQEEEKFVPEEKLVKDFAEFSNRDIYKIFPQPGIEDFDKDTWVIEESKITNSTLIKGAMTQDEYYRLENVNAEMLSSGRMGEETDPETQERNYAQMDVPVTLPFVGPDAEHTLDEYWGPVPRYFLEPGLQNDEIGKYETVNAWLWVIDGRTVVRKRVTPIIDGTPPYVKGNFIRRLGQFYGIGIGKMLEGLQVEKNEIRNTRADNINLMLQKIIAINKDKVDRKDFDRLKSEPGAAWLFSNIDDVSKAFVPVDFPDITPDSWRSSAEVDREAQEATDVIKTTQTIGSGEDQAGNGTFRGQMLNQQQANQRFVLYARMLEIMGLNETVFKYYQRIYQFKKYDAIDQIIGPQAAKEFELIPPEELSKVAQLVSLGALTTMNKGVELAQRRDFFVLMKEEPFFKKLEYARDMARLMGVQEPDTILWSDQEVQQFNEQKRAMIAEMGGLPGSGQGLPPGGPQGPQGPSGLGSPPPGGPISGGMPGPDMGQPRPSMPPQGPGASPMDVAGRAA
jgi:hypothetical protein